MEQRRNLPDEQFRCCRPRPRLVIEQYARLGAVHCAGRDAACPVRPIKTVIVSDLVPARRIYCYRNNVTSAPCLHGRGSIPIRSYDTLWFQHCHSSEHLVLRLWQLSYRILHRPYLGLVCRRCSLAAAHPPNLPGAERREVVYRSHDTTVHTLCKQQYMPVRYRSSLTGRVQRQSQSRHRQWSHHVASQHSGLCTAHARSHRLMSSRLY